MKVCNNNRKIYTTMEVVPDQGPSLLGFTDCERLGLVKRVDTRIKVVRVMEADMENNKELLDERWAGLRQFLECRNCIPYKLWSLTRLVCKVLPKCA